MATPIKRRTLINKKTGETRTIRKTSRLNKGKRIKSNGGPRRNRRRLA